MAKYSSLFKVEGTLGEVNFYKSEDGYRMRTKGGVSKQRIERDPAFARTRENNQEFSNSAKSGKVLRQSIIDMLADAKDSKLASRLTKQMTIVKNFDVTSVRGSRTLAVGILTPDGKAALIGFDFNKNAILSAVLLSEINLDVATGVITIPDFAPANRLSIPEGATHVSFYAAMLNLDLTTTDKDLQLSNVVNLPINNVETTVVLTPAAVAAGTGQQYNLLKLAFFQEINGIQYPLRNGAFNALKVLNIT